MVPLDYVYLGYLLLWKLVEAVMAKYQGKTKLSIIPEKSEEDEKPVTKWVPKEKHKLLKAKYKCLMSLFQVYDASLINMLPEPYVKTEEKRKIKEKSKKKRRKTHRHRTDQCEGTGEATSDCKTTSDCDKDSFVVGAMLKDLKMKNCTIGPTLVDQVGANEPETESCMSSRSIENSISTHRNINCTQTSNYALNQNQNQRALQPSSGNEVQKWTRMQIFKYRFLGRRPKGNSNRRNLELPQHVQSLSEPAFLERGYRTRRRIRFRRTQKPKMIRSDKELGDNQIMNYVQSVQRNYLLDTTARCCPFPGCKMVLHGIINYNDHLRLCHFPERKYPCLYCHEGFETEYEKLIHENEHIGIAKVSAVHNTPSSVIYDNPRNIKNGQSEHDKTVQCDVVSEEKLKKIVSYFDKIATGDGSIDAMSRLDSCHNVCSRQFDTCCSRYKNCGSVQLACKKCGFIFPNRKQLNRHMDVEHNMSKYSKFHSFCALPVKKHIDCMTEDGTLNVESLENCEARSSCSKRTVIDNCHKELSKTTVKDNELSKSALSLDFDPSTNIVYYHTTSMESICKKSSNFDRFVKKVKSFNGPLKWEPSEVVHV